MPVYHKLVRDHIPAILEKKGLSYQTKILHNSDYKDALHAKLQEEIKEYLEADKDHESLEELADILEVMHALAKTHGADIAKVEEIRKKKAEDRGKFEDKVLLVEVGDE
ncbi:nucleoside triphosphate pyrophosphohydrolase [Gracilibacillus thailandensis]|uniref:Phosphoribosyl-ATP pyrophosphohydrolase n=1 Tax=Gracilibacillus thailandensis TaxID=563735 RepID=A0A6N7R0D6_9BACI|nr:nucleoside triphosphate pyrophosphohydrolase [Gracilibacillus thailandensis]MRI66615.1 phosphoribosyl-ATP pyrophosphohydrolase [Gracilibacillus thailandensis]